MPPRKKQPARQAQAPPTQVVSAEVVAKRIKRNLDELERSNYSETTNLVDSEEKPGVGVAKGRARDIISERKPGPGVSGKRKSTQNVRSALIYPKNLQQTIELSGIADFPPTIPTYITAIAPPPREPPRALCSVCGYWGKYKCRRCAMSYCDLNCQATHNETRCEKRVI